MLKLEVGKKYLDGVGAKVEIMNYCPFENTYEGENCRRYTPDGFLAGWENRETPGHLVKETKGKETSPDTSATLDEMLKIIGDREAQYGPPVQNFADIAEIWQTYLQQYWKRNPDKAMEIDKYLVADLMTLLKMVRNHESRKHDSYVDACNYQRIAGDFLENEDR